jgi:hypothetical protein
MAFTHTIRTTFSSTGGASVQGAVATVADAEDNRDITVPPATTDMPVALTLAFAQLKSLFMLSDKDVSFQTNNAAVPIDTINLKANVPYQWVSAGGVTNPITTNITSVFLTNAGATAATVQIRIAVDSTP